MLWCHVPSVPVSLFTLVTESVVVTCTQCTSVTIYTVPRVCCGDMYPVYQCHYLHRAQSLLWWHVPSVPVSLFTPCIESVVVSCTQCTSVTIYTGHRVCCGDMYPVYQCHYLHRAQSLLWWHVPSVPVYQCHYSHRAQSLLWWHVPSVPVSLFTPCIECVVVSCTQCTSVTIYTGHRVCCGDMYPVYQCHYLHRAQSLLWWHVPSVPVSLFTPCTESVVVTCTQCTSVTIYTVHRVCCGVMYPVYQCHYLHWSQSLLWWHVPSVPVSLFTPCTESVVVICTQCTCVLVSLFTPCIESVVVICTSVPVSLFTLCTESVVVTCTQCTSVTIYTVHRVCCGDMYPVYQCTSVTIYTVHRVCCGDMYPVYQCTSVTIYTVHRVCCGDMYPVYQCTSVTIYTVHRVCCGDMYMYPVYQCHYLHRAQSLLWWHVPVYQCHYLHCAQSLLWWHVPSVPVY